MTSTPRGYAVIITMTKGRGGADVDERNIAELFQQLNFGVIKLTDKTKDVFSQMDCCIIVEHCSVCNVLDYAYFRVQADLRTITKNLIVNGMCYSRVSCLQRSKFVKIIVGAH